MPRERLSDQGRRSNCAGAVAEEAVARHYDRAGLPVCARRWRGRHGEIDLIARNGDQVVVIEVKQGATHDAARSHLHMAQVARIFHAAAEFVEDEPAAGLTDLRFDLALVDGRGQILVHENFWAN